MTMTPDIRKKFLTTLAALFLATVPAAAHAAQHKEVALPLKQGTLTLIPLNDNALRVRFTPAGGEAAPLQELIYTEPVPTPRYRLREAEGIVTLSLAGLSVEFDRRSETLTFRDAAGRVVLRERAGGRSATPSSVQGEPTWRVEQAFVCPPDEHLYGTGQFQDGYLDIRGLTRRLTQVNTQIAIPFVLSSKGYGLLWNNYGLTDFNPADRSLVLTPAEAEGEAVTVDATSTGGNVREVRRINAFTGEVEVPGAGRYALLLDVGQSMARKHYLSIDGVNVIDVNNTWLPPTASVIVELAGGRHRIEVRGERNDRPTLHWRAVTDETVFRSPVAQAVDYTVFAGDAERVIASYRALTGPAPMMPLWALGYIHCRERYNTQEELLENARGFRERGLPIDLIVQDWQYWGKYGWNAMRFDEERYPDPAEMMEELHGMDMRLMLSVWSKIDKQSEVGRQAEAHGYYIPQTDWIDFFNPEAAAFYWRNFSERLLKPYRIDAWWQDATEPENDDLRGRRIAAGSAPGELYRNVYPMFVSQTIYEGLRRDDPGRRAMIFTRSGFSGMQRYAAATWSGDVGHDWETLRRQITGGLGQMASGLPWWTYDAGGFFRPSDQYTDPAYHEQLIRWFQAGTFFPMMRVHGYMSDTEPWRYGSRVEAIMADYLALRYRLLPYVYSQNAAVSFEGSTLMRPLVMDFADDPRALEQRHQFMFGPSMLVAPVVEAAVSRWSVYLPEHPAGWIDFWSGEVHPGGGEVSTPVDLSKTPLFVRGGSILPLGPAKQYAAEPTDAPWEIRVYPGADATFTVYEDEGDNYNYERGAFSTFELAWDDDSQTFSVSRRKGSFPGMRERIALNVVVVSPGVGTGIEPSPASRSVVYTGRAMRVKMND